MNNFLVRQGDILIKKIEVLPDGLNQRKNTVILYGEATGHKHQLADGKVFDGKDTIYLKVIKKTQIRHDEHKPINLSKGFYAVIRQREYQKDQDGELIEIDLGSDPEKTAKYIHIKDSSTNRFYYLRVPPTIKTCKGGRAWSFGIEEKDFKLVEET